MHKRCRAQQTNVKGVKKDIVRISHELKETKMISVIHVATPSVVTTSMVSPPGGSKESLSFSSVWPC